jgi:hypothetical protein
MLLDLGCLHVPISKLDAKREYLRSDRVSKRLVHSNFLEISVLLF